MITGTVFTVSKNPISYANVYYQGSFCGTQTDSTGYFSIQQKQGLPLIISAVGYHSKEIHSNSPNDVLQIVLRSKNIKLDEVTIKDRSLVKKRNKYLRIFRRSFLGNDISSKDCYIQNEEAIKFNYQLKDTIQAFSNVPLKIVNVALGYELEYFLEKFEYCKKKQAINYHGTVRFLNDLKSSDSLTISKRREYMYYGSRMHFLRALWSNELQNEGFVVKNKNGENLNLGDLVRKDKIGKGILFISEKLYLEYYASQSELTFPNGMTSFEKDGYFNPSSMLWSGVMAKQRVANLLPFEYSVNK
jgi:hypothetical protein